jgi:hypothetical protein
MKKVGWRMMMYDERGGWRMRIDNQSGMKLENRVQESRMKNDDE